MSCTVQATQPCGLFFNSDRRQQQSLLYLLKAVLAELGGTDYADWSAVLIATEDAGLTCIQQGQNLAATAQSVCDGLVDIDCKALDCYQDSELSAMQRLLVCQIVDKINP